MDDQPKLTKLDMVHPRTFFSENIRKQQVDENARLAENRKRQDNYRTAQHCVRVVQSGGNRHRRIDMLEAESLYVR
jgi:hypothetical protein